MTDTPSSALLPERYPQHDLFICDVADAVIKDVLQHMEHPFYSLSKKPDTSIRRYENGPNYIEIIPSVKGLATIYDKDILIYCISQIIAKMRRGENISRRVRINTRELLIFSNRGTAGGDYKAIVDALDRLAGTRISTNVRTGNEEQYSTFGLIDAASIRRKHGLDGRLLWCDVQLSDWVFNAIKAQEVLTLHRDYFRLRKPIERRLYEIARKHCGQQSEWKVNLPLLLKKTGAKSSEKRFRQMVKDLARQDHLPDYRVLFDEDLDTVTFVNRGDMPFTAPEFDGALPAEAIAEARSVAPGWDLAHLERQWRRWIAEQDIVPRSPGAHFVRFCRSWYERHGAP